MRHSPWPWKTVVGLQSQSRELLLCYYVHVPNYYDGFTPYCSAVMGRRSVHVYTDGGQRSASYVLFWYYPSYFLRKISPLG